MLTAGRPDSCVLRIILPRSPRRYTETVHPSKVGISESDSERDRLKMHHSLPFGIRARGDRHRSSDSPGRAIVGVSVGRMLTSASLFSECSNFQSGFEGSSLDERCQNIISTNGLMQEEKAKNVLETVKSPPLTSHYCPDRSSPRSVVPYPWDRL